MSVLAGRSVLVTAGGTREPIDAVRFVGNRSSGRMGAALAAEARRRGADVTLIAANLSVEPPAGVEVVETHRCRSGAGDAAARGLGRRPDDGRGGRLPRRAQSRASAARTTGRGSSNWSRRKTSFAR